MGSRSKKFCRLHRSAFVMAPSFNFCTEPKRTKKVFCLIRETQSLQEQIQKQMRPFLNFHCLGDLFCFFFFPKKPWAVPGMDVQCSQDCDCSLNLRASTRGSALIAASLGAAGSPVIPARGEHGGGELCS